MSDQAQGLRDLADHMRSEHPGIDCQAAVSSSHGTERSSALLDAYDLPFLPGMAAIDGRLHSQPVRAMPLPRARILAITSGKGGVGKSNFSANLSITLGQQGKRVIMLDADMGMANAHILLGASPRYSLEQVIHGTKSLSDVLHPVGENVKLIAGGLGIMELGNLTDSARDTLLSGLRELDTTCDLIVIDTGAGLASNVLPFLCAVNEIIVVTTPEPTAITNAYATIKVVSQQNQGARLMLLVNMVHSSGEGEAVANRLAAITRKFLDLDVEYIGCIPKDPAVSKAVMLRTPFVSNAPECPAAHGINQIIRQLGYGQPDARPQSGMEGFVSRMQRFFGIKAAL